MPQEPMIPKSMHDSAIEAARSGGRQNAEQEAMALVARLVEAAGGEVRLTRRALVDDPPEVFMSEAGDFSGTLVYRTKRYHIARAIEERDAQ